MQKKRNKLKSQSETRLLNSFREDRTPIKQSRNSMMCSVEDYLNVETKSAFGIKGYQLPTFDDTVD